MAGSEDIQVLRTTDHPPPLAGGALAVTAASALFVLAGYIINVVLGRALGPVDYGLFGVVIGLMTVVNALQTSAVPQAIAKFAAEHRYDPGDLLLTGGLLQVGSGIALAIVLFLLADPIATLLHDGELAAPLRLAALAFPSYALFALLLGLEGGHGRYVRQALMMSLYSVAKAVLAVSLGLLFSLLGAIAGYVVAPAVAALTSSEILRFRQGRLMSLGPIASYSIPLLSLAAVSIAYLNLDLFLVKSLVADPASAGYYTAAQNIARVPYYLSTGLAAILLPAVARVATSDPRRARLMVGDALRFGVLLLLPIAVVLVAGAREAVQLLYGERYVSATGPLMLLSAAMGVFAFFSFLSSLLAGIGRPSHAVLAAAAGLVTTAAIAVVLIPASAMQGAALATLAGAVTALLLALAATSRALPFEVPWLTLARVGIASAVVGMIAENLNGAAAVLLGLPLVGLLYVGMLIVTRELGPDDWQRLREVLPARRSLR